MNIPVIPNEWQREQDEQNQGDDFSMTGSRFAEDSHAQRHPARDQKPQGR